MKLLPVRLHPDQDLRQRLQQWAIAHDLQAGCIISAIGSLKQSAIRFAAQDAIAVVQAPTEILALHGTLSVHGLHLHIVIADRFGNVVGGHLCDGCLIRTTAEIVIGEIPDRVFFRRFDPQTGYLELDIRDRPAPVASQPSSQAIQD